MASQERKSDTGLEAELYDAFYEFSFFKAVELLEKFSPAKKRIGTTIEPDKEPVRFKVSPGLSFPASDIAGLKKNVEENLTEMDVTFMGLIGPSGLLPNWYNELAIAQRKKKDHALIDFLNIFHHRLISLFYLAWKKPRFPENYESGAGDRLSRHLLSLAGLGTSGMVGMLGLPRESLTFYSGLLSLPVASARSIEAVIEYFSGAKTIVDQFVERDVPFDETDYTRLGQANAVLGKDAVCGTHVKECQTKFRVNVGPVAYDTYMRLMPTGDLLFPVFSLIRYMVGIEFEFEIKAILQKEDVPGCILGQKGAGQNMLGLTTWAASPEHAFEEDQYITFQEVDLQQMKRSMERQT